MAGLKDRFRVAGTFFRVAKRDLLGVGGAWPVSDRTVRRLIRMGEIRGGETVVDAGAGHGNVARLLLSVDPPPGRIYSVERSPEMFRLLLENAAGFGDSRLTAVQADVRDLPAKLDGSQGKVDLIISTIPVSRASRMDDIFAIFAQVLRPGGRLVQVSSDPFHGPKQMRRAGFSVAERRLDWYGLFPFFLFKAYRQ